MDTKKQSGPASAALTVDEVAFCTREAQKEGVFAGVTSGLLGGLLGTRVFKFNRNTTIFCGIMTGVLSGYFFTQAFLNTRLHQAVTQKALLAQRTSELDAFQPDCAEGSTTSSS